MYDRKSAKCAVSLELLAPSDIVSKDGLVQSLTVLEHNIVVYSYGLSSAQLTDENADFEQPQLLVAALPAFSEVWVWLRCLLSYHS